MAKTSMIEVNKPRYEVTDEAYNVFRMLPIFQVLDRIALEKSAEDRAKFMATRMKRLIERRPELKDKYEEADEKMRERAEETKQRRREEAPGPTHENLEQEDDTAKSTTRFYADTRQGYGKSAPKIETKQQYWVGGGKVTEAKGASATLKGDAGMAGGGGSSGSGGGSYGGEQTSGQANAPATRRKVVKEYDDEGQKVRDEIVHKGADGSVSSVAVVHGHHILMGKRRDNGKWTLPGGHLESGEDPHDGGKRELKEEAGIEAEKLKHLKTKKITTHTGKEKTIHAFKYEVSVRPKTTMVADPDQEVESWKWIKHKDGLPKHVKENLHSPKNIVLEALAIKSDNIGGQPRQADPPKYYVTSGGNQNGTAGNIASMREEAKKRGKDFAHGGIVSKEAFKTKEKIKDVEYDENSGEVKRSLIFVRDLIKSGSHKYIRKYKGRTGEWVYIYHEGDHHHRLTEEDIAAHKHLAEHGDSDERTLHSDLISNIQTMGDEDIV